MAAWLRRLLIAPEDPRDPELTAFGRLFNIAALTALLASVVAIANNLVAGDWRFAMILIAFMVATVALIVAARRGHVGFAGAALPVILLVMFMSAPLIRDGVHDSAMFAIAGALALAGVMLKGWWLVALVATAVGGFFAMGYAEMTGLLLNRFAGFTDFRYLIGVSLSLALIPAVARALAHDMVANLLQVRRAQDRLELAIQASRSSLWEWDIARGTMYFDEAWTKAFGLGAGGSEATLQELQRIIHPEDLEHLVAAQLACIKGETPDYAQEARVRNLAGQWVWILGRGRVTERGPGGRALRMAGIVLDVTERKDAELRLRQSEDRFEKVFRASPGAIAITRLSDGRHFDVNEAWVGIFGYSRDEVIGRSSLDVGVWAEPAERSRFVEEIRRRGAVRDFEIRFRKKSGATIHALASAEVIDIDGEAHIIVPILDITDRKRAEELLNHIARGVSSQTGEAFFREVVLCLCRELPADMAFVGEVTPERDGIRTIACCRDGELSENFDYPLAGSPCIGVLDRRGTLVYPDRAAELFPEDVGLRNHAIAGYAGTSLIDTTGKAAGILVALTRKPIEREEFFVSLLEILASRAAAEIERSRSEERIRHLATRDTLTGLPNRLLLNDRLTLAMSHAQRTQVGLALLFIDLDRFKVINDSLGHAIGDAFLRAVAARLSSIVRKGDTLARLGGDEFVVLLENVETKEDIAGQVARKILAGFAEPFLVEGYTLSCSCSIGISLYPSDATDANTLIRDADTAMYHVKESGRGSYRYFAAEMNQRAQERLQIENGLREAIAKRQFELMYQPKVSLATGEVTGFEALLRWRHPTWGVVPPWRFIAVAEETGLIVDIGRWVLEEACRRICEWGARGLPLQPFAVNLSVRQLAPGLTEEISSALARFGVDAGMIELEITESLFMRNPDEVGAVLKDLARLGMRVTIDDFGTGYSSLGYLRNFAVNALKIDRAFVSDLSASSQNVPIVSAIITMCRGLGIRVIAEGVETREQLEILESLRCDEYQGYLFCPPVPAEQLERQYLEAAGRERGRRSRGWM